MSEQKKTEYVGTAFLSCSLREEDNQFNEFVEKILKAHKIKPIGTVGRHSAAPMNIPQHMKENIPKADFVVIAATPRYFQKDLQSGKKNYGLSEMVHVETGMAYMADKPVVVFVQEGTNVGNFLPNITEFVVLNGKNDDLTNKWSLINSLMDNAYQLVLKIKKQQEPSLTLGGIVKTGLAIFGGIKVLEYLGSDDDDK